MTVKTFLTVHSVIYGVFAVALFFLPGLMWPLYGVELNDKYAVFLSQHNSIFLGGIAILSYMFRDLVDTVIIKKLLSGLMYTNILGVVVTLYACINGIFVGFGWSDPAFFALLVFLCFWQTKKQESV